MSAVSDVCVYSEFRFSNSPHTNFAMIILTYNWICQYRPRLIQALLQVDFQIQAIVICQTKPSTSFYSKCAAELISYRKYEVAKQQATLDDDTNTLALTLSVVTLLGIASIPHIQQVLTFGVLHAEFSSRNRYEPLPVRWYFHLGTILRCHNLIRLAVFANHIFWIVHSELHDFP